MSDTSEFRMIKTIYEVCEKLDKAVVGDMVENVQDIIHTHAMIAAGSALIPVPGASTVATIGNIWTMYYNINQEVGVTLSKNALKSIASAVIANLGASTIVLAVSEACKFIPGIGSLAGMALGAATAYAVTIASAYIYLKVLSLLASKKRLGYYEKDLAGTVNDFMATNKDIINDIMNDAKKEYKSTKK